MILTSTSNIIWCTSFIIKAESFIKNTSAKFYESKTIKMKSKYLPTRFRRYLLIYVKAMINSNTIGQNYCSNLLSISSKTYENVNTCFLIRFQSFIEMVASCSQISHIFVSSHFLLLNCASVSQYFI